MGQKVVVARNVGEINRTHWAEICPESDDLLMSPQFLRAVEQSMRPGSAGDREYDTPTEFWYLLAYCDDRPVGAACVVEYPLDTAMFLSAAIQKPIRLLQRIFPRYLKFRITFCGLPVSTAGSNLRIRSDADTGSVLDQLNRAIEQIAKERKTWLVVYKEFDRAESDRFDALKSTDYERLDSLPMNFIGNRFANFTAMLAAMRSHYRYKITKSRKKFAKSGLTLRRTTGREELARLYSPDLHAMYERVTRGAEHRLEILPRDFFLNLAEEFPRELILTTIHRDDEVLAFAWSLRHGGVYRNLFVGIDYEANEETDAYFNLMIEDIDHAMSEPLEQMLVGQTADEFKSRLGCESDPRYLFVKLTSRWMQWCFRKTANRLMAPPPPPPTREVFKEESEPVGSLPSEKATTLGGS